jgi:hypothetical protein
MRLRPGDPLEFDCPECHTPLEVVERDGNIALQQAPPAAPPAERSVISSVTFAKPAEASRQTWASLRSFIAARAKDPLFVTWTVAGVAAVGIAIAFWTTSEQPATVAPKSTEQSAEPSNVPARSEESGEIASLVPTPEPIEAPRLMTPRPEPVEATQPPAAAAPDPRELIAASLSRRVLTFEQATPVPFEQLRFQLEELVGFPIEYGFVGAEQRQNEPVAITLANVTMEELVTEVAARAGLKPSITDTGIRLLPIGTPVGAVSDANGMSR